MFAKGKSEFKTRSAIFDLARNAVGPPVGIFFVTRPAVSVLYDQMR